MIGPERIFWRCGPIILKDKCTIQCHVHYFEELAKDKSQREECSCMSSVNIGMYIDLCGIFFKADAALPS